MKQLWLDADTESAVLLELPCGQLAVYSRRNPDSAGANEDAVLVLPIGDSRAVLAVADGCGGLTGGADASRITLQALQRSVKSANGSLRSAILDGIEDANAKVLELGIGAATTLAVAEIDGDQMRAYHIGDSQIVMVGGRGKVKLQTPAHSPVGYAVEAGVLSDSEAMTHEHRHLVSNVVGTAECRVEIGMFRRMAKRDTFIVASDGVFDNLQMVEVCNIIRHGQLAGAASHLAEEVAIRIASDRDDNPSKPDDATFIIYRRK